jgi:adenosine/AMP kinase
MELKVIEMKIPDGCNIILGQSHFIKTVGDIFNALASSSAGIKFGVAFSEASGDCLIRTEGNDTVLKDVAIENSLALGCGHSFNVIMKDAYPINVLTQLKAVPEVCQIFAATANPLQVVIAETNQGRGVLGVIDGSQPKGVESLEDVRKRNDFLKMIGYTP